jgi:hypothetical protein
VSRDRWVDLALRAFPRRFRAERSEEMRAVIAEARAVGDRDADSMRTLIDLVRSGWAERLRTRPPLRDYARYRMIGRPLPPAWHGWMREDVAGALFGLRAGLSTLVIFVAVIVGLSFTFGGGVQAKGWSFVATQILVFMVVGLAATRPLRSRVLRDHGVAALDGAVASHQKAWDVAAPPLLARWPAAPLAAGLCVASIVGSVAAASALLGPLRIRFDHLGMGTQPPLAEHQHTVGLVAIGVAVAVAVVALVVVLIGRGPRLVAVDDLTGVTLRSRRLAWGIAAAVGLGVVLVARSPVAPVVHGLLVGAGGLAPAALVLAWRAHRWGRVRSSVIVRQPPR